MVLAVLQPVTFVPNGAQFSANSSSTKCYWPALSAPDFRPRDKVRRTFCTCWRGLDTSERPTRGANNLIPPVKCTPVELGVLVLLNCPCLGGWRLSSSGPVAFHTFLRLLVHNLHLTCAWSGRVDSQMPALPMSAGKAGPAPAAAAPKQQRELFRESELVLKWSTVRNRVSACKRWQGKGGATGQRRCQGVLSSFEAPGEPLQSVCMPLQRCCTVHSFQTLCCLATLPPGRRIPQPGQHVLHEQRAAGGGHGVREGQQHTRSRADSLHQQLLWHGTARSEAPHLPT